MAFCVKCLILVGEVTRIAETAFRSAEVGGLRLTKRRFSVRFWILTFSNGGMEMYLSMAPLEWRKSTFILCTGTFKRNISDVKPLRRLCERMW